MRIPESKIDEIRSASDIIDVISSYVPLKKRGKNFLGRCPFHQEKTPSFNVSPEKQMYHCFGCGVGGNVFTFVMELEKVSFIEAVRTLAERGGIALPAEGGDSTQATENEELYNACRLAGLHFHENLMSTVEGKLALEYFHHRGFTDETIRKFGLGYSMHSWDALLKHAQAKGIDIATMEKAGLVIRREDNSGVYDRFRGRAIFPIFSASGRPIGFGARKMREDDTVPGKYINSPETPVYVKSRNLYGLYHAKEAIRAKEFAILVEGYADLISVFQAGIENIIASSGTALTEEQILLIGRYAKNITLVYDADSAGSKATMRGVDMIIESGLDVKVAELPPGEDPDSFVGKHGAGEFQNLLDNAVTFLDFKAKSFQQQGVLETPDGQTRAVRSIVETISRMGDELKRNFYIKTVAEKYGIYETVLFRELEKLMGKSMGGQQVARQRLSQAPRREGAAQQEQIATPVTPLSAPERDLIKLMLEHGNDMVGYVFSHVQPDVFAHPQGREVIRRILGCAESGKAWSTASLLSDIAEADLRRFITDITFNKYEISRGWAEIGSVPEEADPAIIAEHCILILRRQELDRLLEENQRHMKEAVARGEQVVEYMQRSQTLLKEKKELENLSSSGRKALA
jgi:DNA primase